MAFGTRSHHTRHQRLAARSFPLQLRAWRKRENLSQSEAALKLQISKEGQKGSGQKGSEWACIDSSDSEEGSIPIVYLGLFCWLD